MAKKGKERRKRSDSYVPDYDPDFHPQDLIDRMAARQINAEVAAAWNMSVDTMNIWRKTHPELEDAYQRGLTKFEAAMKTDILDKMISGEIEGRHAFNAASLIYANKLGYRTNRGESTTNTQINVGNVNLLANKSTPELIEVLNKDLKYLVDYNVLDVESIELKEVTDESKSKSDR